MFKNPLELVNVLDSMALISVLTDTHGFFALRTNDSSDNMQEIRSVDQD